MTPPRRLAAAAALTLLVVVGAATWLVVRARPSDSPLNFANSGADMSGARVLPGRSESFAAFLNAKPAGMPFQVTHVSLIPLRGFRTPQLLGSVFLRQRTVPLQADGWPPRNDAGGLVPVHATARYTVRSGAIPHKIQIVLMFGLRGARLGAYAVAGLRVTYEVKDHAYTTNIYNGAYLFYYPPQETHAQREKNLAEYARIGDNATAALRDLPAVKAILAQNAS